VAALAAAATAAAVEPYSGGGGGSSSWTHNLPVLIPFERDSFSAVAALSLFRKCPSSVGGRLYIGLLLLGLQRFQEWNAST
jgi:hypothetical protein